jgi:hypothetical protein
MLTKIVKEERDRMRTDTALLIIKVMMMGVFSSRHCAYLSMGGNCGGCSD